MANSDLFQATFGRTRTYIKKQNILVWLLYTIINNNTPLRFLEENSIKLMVRPQGMPQFVIARLVELS